MPPKGKSATNGSLKRKATASASPAPSAANKKTKVDASQYKDSTLEEKFGIVLRQFYPPEMTNERAHMYRNGELERPIDAFKKAARETKEAREKIDSKEAVVHWFKCDLRTTDNTALHEASEKAKEIGVPLICVYLVSPQDFQAHFTGSVRVDFILRTLKVLRDDLAQLDIPLHVETVDKRRQLPARLVELCNSWGASHLYANVEYEVDELRREAKMFDLCLEKGISFNAFEDTCVVPPYSLASLSGGQFSVYSPWYRAWLKFLNEKPEVLDEQPEPARNPADAREKFKSLFDCEIPATPKNKELTDEEKKRFESMWPPGEGEAHARLEKFVKNKIQGYKENRDLPSVNNTSVVSVHLAAGTLSARACVRAAQNESSGDKLGYRYAKKIESATIGVVTWIAEIAWRDFYRHVMCHNPWVVMNKPFKPEYSNIEWEYDLEQFEAWKAGKTGYPIVDAAMRQMKYSAYCHNRCRMIVASFLAKDLLIDWRMGERHFMLTLIDGDFASNNGGWGFSASCGVDPQPYFRIFNPLLQSEKFDPDGDYIRKWVPELKGVKGKAIHDPYSRGAEKEAKAAGYPRRIVEHSMARVRCLERYKAGIGRDTA